MTTNHSTITDRPTAADPAASKVGTAVNRVGRLLLIGAIGFTAWYAWTIYADLLHGPRAAAPVVAQPAMAGFPLELLAPLPGDGPWQFNGAPWTVQVGSATPDQVATWLLRDAVVVAPQSDRPFDWEKTLIQLAGAAGKAVATATGERHYVVERSGMKAALWTQQVQGQERVVAGRLALPQAENAWRLMEIRPAPSGQAAVHVTPGLLPLPADAKRSAHRQDDRGEIIAEIVALEGQLSRVVKEWQAQGWTVVELTPAAGQLRGLACRRGDRSMQVWANQAPEQSGPLVMLLVAGPNGPSSR